MRRSLSKRLRGLLQFFSTLFLLPMVLMVVSNGLCASDCGDGGFGGGSTIPGEYDNATSSLLSISGPDEVNKPGTAQYSVMGGFPPYDWNVFGSGIFIDQNGIVTLTEAACGSFTVTISDSIGQSASKPVRIANAGSWVQVSYSNLCMAYSSGEVACLIGNHLYRVIWCLFCGNPSGCANRKSMRDTSS